MLNRIEPQAGQESVWDYPRPPRIEASAERVRVIFGGVLIAESTQSYRILETSHPPVYYLPPSDIQMAYFSLGARRTFCEFKGQAHYWAIQVGDQKLENAAWSYAQPNSAYEAIRDYLAFYPAKMDACWVDEEQVQAQDGDFYGGWITSKIVGPFKGGAGTWGW